MKKRPVFIRAGKAYSTTINGRSFEDHAYGLLEANVASEQFGLLPEYAAIFRRKRYYSRDRADTIEFDISIEVTLPGAPAPSFLWLWECKNYSRPIGVDDLEEFNSKVQQVTGLNVKAGVITSGHLQRAALTYATSRRMAVIRVLPSENVKWMLYYASGSTGTERSSDAFAALTQPIFESLNRTEFGAYDGSYFPLVTELFVRVVSEIPDLPPSVRLRCT